jgi:hypothetical protein
MRLLFLSIVGVACVHPSAPPPPRVDPVVLNHLFFVLDAETAGAVEADSQLAAFAATEKRTSATTDGRSWTGFYLYGRETYLELFGPNDSDAPGAVGIGLAVERIGALDRMRDRLAAEGTAFEVWQEEMLKDGERIPWFRAGGLKSWPDKGPLDLWIGEVVPSFMARRLAPRAVAAGDISGRTYLSIHYDPGRMFEDVCGARIHVDPVERDRFAAAMKIYGWQVKLDGDAAIAEGAGVRLVVIADKLQRGVEELCLRLRRDGDGAERAIGRSMLRLGPGAKATWRFQLAAAHL